MKFKSILHTLIFCLLSITITAQNVSILPTGITPAPAASYPRISYDQILALPAPQAGDMAYDLTFNCLRVFNGTKWLQLITTQDIGQVSGFAWQLTSNASLSVNGMVKDASGNIYVTGNFNGTAVFGNTNYISTGDNDVFLAKYTSAGVFQWVRVAGSRAGDIALDVCLDPSGNVLITGYYFDAITFGNTILPYSGACDVFVTKYDPSGNVLWAKFAGGTGLDVSNTIETDAAGNVYFGGYFLGSITFFGNTNITINSLGGEDGFL
ncbi:MAG: hypothetical protein IPO04_15565 [Cytophagaceae bacterium]|nr:hypothetical protein [Cytophagaceae bacterium]